MEGISPYALADAALRISRIEEERNARLQKYASERLSSEDRVKQIEFENEVALMKRD